MSGSGEKRYRKEPNQLDARINFRMFDPNKCTGCLAEARLRSDPKPDLDNANVGMQANQFTIC